MDSSGRRRDAMSPSPSRSQHSEQHHPATDRSPWITSVPTPNVSTQLLSSGRPNMGQAATSIVTRRLRLLLVFCLASVIFQGNWSASTQAKTPRLCLSKDRLYLYDVGPHVKTTTCAERRRVWARYVGWTGPTDGGSSGSVHFKDGWLCEATSGTERQDTGRAGSCQKGRSNFDAGVVILGN
jgi:hypothetical protein